MSTPRLAFFSIMLAMGGLPLYVHLPNYVGSELGISLGILAMVLFGLRAFDMIQDPLLGKILDRYATKLSIISMIAAGAMALGFLGVFVWRFEANTVFWFTVFSLILFTGYSALYILLYRQTSHGDASELNRVTRIREIGLLIGVVVGSVLPLGFARLGWDGYWAYGVFIALFCITASFFARGLWFQAVAENEPLTWRALKTSGATKLLALVFINSLPVAITSTLFLFFVNDKLQMPNWAGGFLALFFLATIAGVLIGGKLAERFGVRQVLFVSMTGAIMSFLWAYFLPEGAGGSFAVICLFSGIFVGVELYLLPLAFARLLQSQNLQAGSAFGAWSFLGKLGLAVAVALVLPLIAWGGYEVGGKNSEQAISALAGAYALLPSLLKIIAIMWMMKLPKEILR